VGQKQIALLIVVAGVMPLMWGWFVHWLLLKFWPQRRPWQRSGENSRAAPPLDYQI